VKTAASVLERARWMMLVGAMVALFAPLEGRADFEIYKQKGFEKVAEVVEKKRNADGTFEVKARKTKDSKEIIEISNVVRIVEVPAKKGVVVSFPPTPTPTYYPYPMQPGQVPAGAPAAPASAAEPPVRGANALVALLPHLKIIIIAVMGVAALVVLFFVLSKSSSA